MKIRVHVGKIVLDGLPVSLRAAPSLGTAVETELVRLLRTYGIAGELHHEGRLAGKTKSSFQLSATSSPTSLGINIARSVYGTLRENHLLKGTTTSATRSGARKSEIAAKGSAR